MTGLYCKFVESRKNEQYSFLDFISNFSKVENVSKVFLNKYEESDRNYVVGKKVLFFSDNMEDNNLQIFNMYKGVCNIALCFDDIYQKPIIDIVPILKEADILFIGVLSGKFIYENEKYMKKLITLLAEHIEIITVFPILNTYERLELMKEKGNIIKSIYK